MTSHMLRSTFYWFLAPRRRDRIRPQRLRDRQYVAGQPGFPNRAIARIGSRRGPRACFSNGEQAWLGGLVANRAIPRSSPALDQRKITINAAQRIARVGRPAFGTTTRKPEVEFFRLKTRSSTADFLRHRMESAGKGMGPWRKFVSECGQTKTASKKPGSSTTRTSTISGTSRPSRPASKLMQGANKSRVRSTLACTLRHTPVGRWPRPARRGSTGPSG